MAGFNVIGLNAGYQIVSLLRFTNLQWTRKYHESGSFSVQIPLKQYDPEMKYIYTPDRPEMGKITQVNYVSQNGYEYIQLSGYFLEHELNRRVVYQSGYTNISNPPGWIVQKGNAENVACAFFDAFKDLKANIDYGSEPFYMETHLDIERSASLGRGNYAEHTRNGEYLDQKIYDILKPSGMSYRVVYDFYANKKTFSCWMGTDRRSDQQTENPVVFSTKYGNIKNPNVLLDSTEYRNACIVANEYHNNDVESVYARAVFGRAEGEGDYDDHFLYLKSSLNRGDYDEETFYPAMDNEGAVELREHTKTVNVEFDAMESSYEYRTDFDLGDYCSVEIPEMYFSADARIIGCYEVIKSGQWSMTLEFGTPIIRRIMK